LQYHSQQVTPARQAVLPMEFWFTRCTD